MRDVRFTNEHDTASAGNVIDVLKRPRLWIPTTDYPDYPLWLDKVEAELDTQAKRAMLAYSGTEPVGVVLYQRHKEQSDTVEIKNISVSPDVRGRYFGSFLLRNVEAEALGSDFPTCSKMVVDTKLSNFDMINFLLKHRYRPTLITDLYRLGGGEDIVLTKDCGDS